VTEGKEGRKREKESNSPRSTTRNRGEPQNHPSEGRMEQTLKTPIGRRK